MEKITISQALPRDTESVSSILLEAARWLGERGIPMWRGDELSPEQIESDVAIIATARSVSTSSLVTS